MVSFTEGVTEMTEHGTATALKTNYDDSCIVKMKVSNEIKVTIHLPENVHETIRQQKINKIYDLLNPESLH